MTGSELRQKYIEFFKTRSHAVIPSAPLVPENDPTVLFTTAGMHPLVPYLLGQPHPQGKRLVDYQKCLRTDDIDEVGDPIHHTFFEMLGNWSLGDYFKKDAITWSYEFLSQVLKIDPNRLFVTCFAGDEDAPKDEESAEIWQNLGIPQERIFFLGKKDNWWGPAGLTGPCGPDTEMHYDITQSPCGPDCRPGCDCGRFTEIWNDVFMQYNKTSDGKYETLSQPNVDTGMGLERALAIVSGLDDDYLTDLWQPLIDEIANLTNQVYSKNTKRFRVIADHVRAAVFLIADNVQPSNKAQGYILRRLIRRFTLQLRQLGVADLNSAATKLSQVVVDTYSDPYSELTSQQSTIQSTIEDEVVRFGRSLDRGLKEFNKHPKITGKVAFDLFQTYGFPWEISAELAKDQGQDVDESEFKTEFENHQNLSRSTSQGMFKGGLADQSEITTKYHTATHLLHQSLRQILGSHVQQVGSNITADRLRFDFTHPEALTPTQISQLESLINSQIEAGLAVQRDEMSLTDAQAQGALAFFTHKYSDRVSVYSIGSFSKEVCGGPHVSNTREIGPLAIYKQEAVGAGRRRLYARLK